MEKVVSSRRLRRDARLRTVRSALSEEGAPLGVFVDAASDVSGEVRAVVASHSATPVVVLEALSLDSDPQVRAGVAGNVRTPNGALQRLSRDPIRQVWGAVATNPVFGLKVPVDVSESLI